MLEKQITVWFLQMLFIYSNHYYWDEGVEAMKLPWDKGRKCLPDRPGTEQTCMSHYPWQKKIPIQTNIVMQINKLLYYIHTTIFTIKHKNRL